MFEIVQTKIEKLNDPSIYPHYPVGKVTMLPVFPFSSSLSNISTVFLSTIEHFKISGSLLLHYKEPV
jgi:hypothetical protein